MAELCAKITNNPNTNRMMIIGASQKRFRTLRKFQNSFIMDNLAIEIFSCYLTFRTVVDIVLY